MTNFNRSTLPDSVRSNGATPNPWWANAVVYQVYPRSFQDTNGDGIGDLKGITSRLDYLADLGVDVVWLSPVYKSPQDDNGYDISDYQDIDPLFGTLEDMDELLAEAHKRGLEIVMDLVVNHTSDEHAWFQASRDKDDPHADWYWWRPAKPGHEPGTPGAEPNQWGSYFGGSAWEYDPKRGEYFFHQYSKKQPDLNWENPEVRKAVYKMMNWWMDRGIDGFRMDVITQVSKTVDKNGKLPGEDGCEIEDYPVGEEGYSSPFPWCSDGPRIDEFLAEMRREVFEGREGYMNVGEAPGITPARNEHVTDPKNGELDMLFLFDHVGIDQEGSKWNTVPFEVKNLRARLADQQEAVKNAGWASLFFCNHDQPRVVSRWGNDVDRESRELSAKAFGMLLHMHRGTPYIYEGEELGMTNAHFTTLEQYRDLESINGYRQRVEEAKCQSAESMMDALALIGRDNARTPMQWDASRYAGFTAPDAATEPWIGVNPNHVEINAAEEFDDPESVYSFYKKLIAMRHNNATIATGEWNLIAADSEQVYSFTRTSGDDTILVIVNLTDKTAQVPAEVAQLLEDGVGESQVLLSTYDAVHSVKSVARGELARWEGVVIQL
ncbi:glycoside hydrolase family 13 protein [Bifidobacterium pseudocatenulatum]|uniref:glycoside hydrolase family 13 protein n=1 Tax=Bifidobacterium pseudocatenulatum TaxID=28026 RepID=UPI0022DFCE94|nr:alpha-glucosidase [Bifidobacterium pseudocatenulatum]